MIYATVLVLGTVQWDICTGVCKTSDSLGSWKYRVIFYRHVTLLIVPNREPEVATHPQQLIWVSKHSLWRAGVLLQQTRFSGNHTPLIGSQPASESDVAAAGKDVSLAEYCIAWKCRHPDLPFEPFSCGHLAVRSLKKDQVFSM